MKQIRSENWWENNMKQIWLRCFLTYNLLRDSVFLDILPYTIGNIIFFIFKNFELNLIIIT